MNQENRTDNYEINYFSIQGMSCISCSNKIKSIIQKKGDGVKADVDLTSCLAAVSYSPDATQKEVFISAVEIEGYKMTEIEEENYHAYIKPSLKDVFLSTPVPFVKGLIASICIIGFYVGLLTLVSGWYFASVQFEEYRIWILLLSAGLGIQVFLYSILRLHRKNAQLKGAGKSLAASGGISTFGMAACCSHYLITVLPVLGVPFLTTTIASLEVYQTEFFMLGVISNAIGILFMVNLMKKNRMIFN